MEAVGEIKKIIDQAISDGRNLYEFEAKEVMKLIGIPTPKNKFIPIEEIGGEIEVGFDPPYVVKIVSRDIIHKTDVGGVILDVSREELNLAIDKLLTNVRRRAAKARIEGVLVEEMAEKGVETIVGMTRDPQFGPVVMFGLGGIFVEIYRDVSFRLAPLNIDEALDMIKEVKAYQILKGYRGYPPADLEAIADTIVKVGDLGSKFREIREIDINPLIAYPKGVLALDVRIILGV